MLNAGDKAPHFTLPDAEGNMVSLEDFAGRKLVIYFYSKDNTAGCTKQACAFRQEYPEIEALGASVIGISKDSIKSHMNFMERNLLPFILLSDTELEAVQAYGVWQEKKNYGKTYMGVVRTTFIVDENGIIEKVFEKVKPDKNASQVLEYLRNKTEEIENNTSKGIKRIK